MKRSLLNWLWKATQSWPATGRAVAQLALASCLILIATCLGAAALGLAAAVLTGMWEGH